MNLQQRTNLHLLKDFLQTFVKDEQFNMSYYRASPSPYTEGILHAADYVDEDHCGTVGCVLGWAPLIIPTISEDFGTLGITAPEPYLRFRAFSERVFGFSEDTGPVGKYLFDAKWRLIDDTRQGALERLQEFLDFKGTFDEAEEHFANKFHEAQISAGM